MLRLKKKLGTDPKEDQLTNLIQSLIDKKCILLINLYRNIKAIRTMQKN